MSKVKKMAIKLFVISSNSKISGYYKMKWEDLTKKEKQDFYDFAKVCSKTTMTKPKYKIGDTIIYNNRPYQINGSEYKEVKNEWPSTTKTNQTNYKCWVYEIRDNKNKVIYYVREHELTNQNDV